MNIELFNSRICPVFMKCAAFAKNWLLRSLICIVIFAAGSGRVFAQAPRVPPRERVLLAELVSRLSDLAPSSLKHFLALIASLTAFLAYLIKSLIEMLAHLDLFPITLGVGLAILATCLPAGKVAEGTFGFQLGKEMKFHFKGTLRLAIGAAAILVILYAFWDAYLKYLGAHASPSMH
jgi:hypothetical protein